MRFPSVAVYTLTALVAGGLTTQASEIPSSDGSHQETATNDSRVATSAVTPKVTAPETLAQPPAHSAELNFASHNPLPEFSTSSTNQLIIVRLPMAVPVAD